MLKRALRAVARTGVAIVISIGLTACGGSGGDSPSPPSISAQPADQAAAPGSAASFSVTAAGAAPISYQWQSSSDGVVFVPIAGATAASYTIAAATLAHDGTRYRVVVGNASGSVISASARLSVRVATANLSCTGSDSTGWCMARAQTIGQGTRLNAVARVSGSVLVAVGDAGTILRSADAGQTWTRVESGETRDLTAVSFADAQYGLAVSAGATVLRSTDGGQTWSFEQPPYWDPLLWFGVRDIAVPAIGSGITVSEFGAIGYRSNGAWSAASIADLGAAVNRFAGVAFASATDGLAIAMASDAGAGGSAAVFRTADGGRSWSGTLIAEPVALNAVALGSLSTAVAVGADAAGQALLRTADGGATWQRAATVNSAALASVAFASPSLVIAVGADGTILRSVDAGATWVRAASLTANPLNGVVFVDAEVGVAVGEYGLILRTMDGGATWSAIREAEVGAKPRHHAVSFASATVGVAVGTQGSILRTADGGMTCASVASNTTEDLTAVDFATAHVGYAVGYAGAMVRTTDGGQTWTPVPSGTTMRLNGVAFADRLHGIAVGDNGLILVTASGGFHASE
jgi:photosystem II stability/assembly factor-like uncharacterized protein